MTSCWLALPADLNYPKFLHARSLLMPGRGVRFFANVKY
jgi:hypothetical protein